MIGRIAELVRANVGLAVLIVLVVALLVGNVYLYMQWRDCGESRAQMETKELTATLNLNGVIAQMDVDGLRAKEARLKETPDIPSKWPSRLPIIELGVLMTEAAAESYVTIDSVSSKLGTETIGGKDYPAYRTVLVVSGPLDNVVEFINYVEAGPFISLKVDGLSLADKGEWWEVELTVVVISGG